MKRLYNWIKRDLREMKDEYKSIKIKKLDKNNNFFWYLLVLVFIFYQAQFFFWPDFINDFFLKTLQFNIYFYLFILDLITLFVVIICFQNELKESFKSFKRDIKSYLKYLLFCIVIFAYISAIITILCNFIVGEIPENQAALEQYNYFYLIFGTIIYAPIVEEIIYRGIVRKFVHNDKMFIIISGLIFGLAHVIGSTSALQYVYVLDYGLTGAFLAFLYTKYNNIYLNISAHFLINFIATSSMLLRLIF